MTRRAFRVLLFLLLLGTAALAGYQGWRLETARVRQLASANAFDALTLRLAEAVVDLRASERAYVSSGQGFAYWKPRVDALLQQIRQDLTTLKSSPATPVEADASIDAAMEALSESARLEKRIAEAAGAGRIQFAADLVYADSLQASLALERAVDTAILAAKSDLAAYQRDARIQELILAAESACIGLFLALMWFPSQKRPAAPVEEASRSTATSTLGLDLPLKVDTSSGGSGGLGSAATIAPNAAPPPSAAAIKREPSAGAAAGARRESWAGAGAGANRESSRGAGAGANRESSGGAGAGAIREASGAATGANREPWAGTGAGARRESSASTGAGANRESSGGTGAGANRESSGGAGAGANREWSGGAGVGANRESSGGTGAGANRESSAAAAAAGNRDASPAGVGGAVGAGGIKRDLATGSGTPIAPPPSAAATADATRRDSLIAAAELCTSLARVTDSGELAGLIAQMSRQLDAVGVIVWLVDPEGLSLRPALSHGYPAEALARLGRLELTTDNATARAFRLARPQTVAAKDSSPGAIVVPITSAAGCVGAVAAELRHGREQDAGTLALARIFAAQLASLTGPAASGQAGPTASGQAGATAGSAASQS